MGGGGPEGAVGVLDAGGACHVLAGDGGLDAGGLDALGGVAGADVVADHLHFGHLVGVGLSELVEGGVAGEGLRALGGAGGVEHGEDGVGVDLERLACVFAGDGLAGELRGRRDAREHEGFEDGAGARGDGGEDLHEPLARLIDRERGADLRAGERGDDVLRGAARAEQDDLRVGGGDEHLAFERDPLADARGDGEARHVGERVGGDDGEDGAAVGLVAAGDAATFGAEGGPAGHPGLEALLEVLVVEAGARDREGAGPHVRISRCAKGERELVRGEDLGAGLLAEHVALGDGGERAVGGAAERLERGDLLVGLRGLR